MPDTPTSCPVCDGKFGDLSSASQRENFISIKCDGCGSFTADGSAFRQILPRNQILKPIHRAALSHWLRSHASTRAKPFHITFDRLQAFLLDARLPTPATQAANLISLIGDSVFEHGEGLFLDPKTHLPVVGAFDDTMLSNLLQQLIDRRIVQDLGKAEISSPSGGVVIGRRFDLTLDGWERYDARKRGRFAGRYGFIAMQFNEPEVKSLIHETVKPAVHDQINYDLVDMNDVSRAGVIDDLMRAQIRDAAFVLADLTHDNSGAYWEAGYAEGLGKPVLYLCQKEKFETRKTHFDTNHCTTVLWSTDDKDPFVAKLIATLRRSLNLF